MKYARTICGSILNKFVGNTDQMDYNLLPIIFGHIPNGASFKQLVGYGQMVLTGRFRKFDHGSAENLKKYNSSTPPDYNLKNTTVPVAVYYGQTDSLAVVEDVRKLIDELPNVVNDYLVPHVATNHMDFFWGVASPRLVNDEIVKTLRSI